MLPLMQMPAIAGLHLMQKYKIMEIKNAKYITDSLKPDQKDSEKHIQAVIDGSNWVITPIDKSRFYIEIMRQVDAGELTIEPADE